MNRRKAPMGWNSWDCYGPSVNEEIVKQNADFMAKHLKKYGWEYIVVDIQWSQPLAKVRAYDSFTELCMDEYSRLIPAENRFPSAEGGKGFAPLAEYVHSLGLKFGIHIMRGIPRQAVHSNTAIKGTDKTARQIAKTASICQWNTDMYGVNPEKEGAKEYYDSLFELYASWGVDFIKIDDICRELPHEESELVMISDSLKNCGRDMVFSLSPGPAVLDKSELYKQVADMWRITDDFWDQWALLYEMFERCEKWSIHTGAGNWPDADMLPIGALEQTENGGRYTRFTEEEQKNMMTLWAIFRSPLMIGGEMTKFDEFTMQLITNEAILKMHSDSRHAHQVWRREVNGVETVLWTAQSSEGGRYIAVFNLGEKDNEFELDFEDLEIYENVNVTELWSGEKAENVSSLKISLPKHGAKAFIAE